MYGTTYNYYIELLFDQIIQSRDIQGLISEWDECAKIVILGDIFKKHCPYLEPDFGKSIFNNRFSRFVLGFYK